MLQWVSRCRFFQQARKSLVRRSYWLRSRAATLYVASYATGVAQGIITQENLETKDYVKIFLGPLIPDPTFGTTVDMIDPIAKGNVLEAYHLYLSQSLPAVLAIGGMAVIDRLTRSSKLAEFLKGLKGLGFVIYLKRAIKFQRSSCSKCCCYSAKA